VVTSMLTAYARTALSPEWDHGFDEAFTDLITSDPDLVREEFDTLIGANFDEPPEPPASPAPPVPPGPPAGQPEITSGPSPADPGACQRSPP
jgi:hypothetical protein